MTNEDDLLEVVRVAARTLAGVNDVQAIVDLVGEARVVLLGEATHGTHEFYRLRTEITKRLVHDRGFDAVAAEADWPDALRVSRYVQGGTDDASATEALRAFERFPRWVWRNAEAVELVEWLRAYNDTIPDAAARVGFFGLDLYSARASMQSVVRCLDRIDPAAAQRARLRYACFDSFGDDPQHYGYATSLGLSGDGETEVLRQLSAQCADLESRLHRDGVASGDELFYAQQNARVVRNAQSYYRTLYQARTDSWNERDTHMADTLDALQAHLGRRRGARGKVVVWAHNSHVGDARATIWSERGQLNLGQVLRQRVHLAGETFLLGFTTHAGTVAAASDWDAPVQPMLLRPSRHASIERVLHESGLGLFLLPLRGDRRLHAVMPGGRLERAVGLIYRPDTELISHYFRVMLTRQFDAIVHVDRSRAVRPLDAPEDWAAGGEGETLPTGL
jgi:erythromycin esterase-like protein